MIIACIAIILSLLSIALNIIFYQKVKTYLTDKRTDCGLDNNGNIRDEIIAVVLGSSHIKEWLPKPQIIQETIQTSNEISTETFNFIVDTVLSVVNKSHPKEEVTSHYDENVGKKYAEAYDSNTGSFYSIDKYPKDTTVYELSIDDAIGEGTFTLCKSAYRMVSECRDYLEGASEVSGTGVSVRIMSVGKISLENGKYIVTKPLEIRFE